MSNQLQATGAVKVRSLTGVLVGTSGVVSSLNIDGSLGIPQLDVNGKILVSQLPNSVMEYKGTWNVTTNTPYLVDGVGNQGDVYIVTNAASTGTAHNFGSGSITFFNGDQVIYSGSIWQRASGATGTVTSVAVTETGDSLNITGSPITTSGTINIGFNGTNLQYVNGAGNLTTFPTLLSSVGLSMPSAFSVANSPLTANGTIAVTGAGYPSQYIRGDGTLADFPTSGGGGSSVSYYLNGGTSQGVIGGVTYYEMSKTADTGTGVDFPKSGNGLIVSFLTDANDPAQLNIPAGNWNYEIYASMSSNGGTPQLYAELYVYDGTTFTLISTSSNEILYDGVNLNLYTFAMTVPSTTLALTDRLAIKLYSTNSGGKTTTVHTQDSHLCQIITTFSTGITALNGLTAQVQYFATGTSGTDFAISSSTATHTFNLPTASATNRGALSSANWSTFNSKQDAISLTTTGTTGAATFISNTLNIPDYTYTLPTATSSILGGVKIGSGVTITSGVISVSTNYQAPITLTTTGSSGSATFVTNTLNVPTYTLSGLGGQPLATNLTSLSGLTYASTSFVKMTASGTFALDTTAYGTGTVTSVAALTLGTTGTDLSSTVATGTTTPVITLNVPTASATNRGALSSTDWSTFNSKESALTFSSPLVRTTNTISIPAATTSVNGYLTSTDWTTFNGKQATITLTTTGTSGAATFTSNTLNIPNYAPDLSGYVPYTGATGAVNLGNYNLTVYGLTIGRGGGNIATNTALGYQAINAGTATQNDQNTAVGYQSLFSNTQGQYNTSLGYQSLYTNIFGASNTAIGWYSLYTNTGDANTGTGKRSLYKNTSGSYNSGFGNSALDQITTGSNNSALGFAAGYGTGTNYITTGSNNIFIGYQSVGESSTESNRTWIGNTTTTSTWVGGKLLVGTRTTGSYDVDVTGTARVTSNIYSGGLGINTVSLTSGWQSDTRGNVLISGSTTTDGRLNVYYGNLGGAASQRLDVGSSTVDVYNLYVKTISGGSFSSTVTAYITNAGAASFNSTLNVGTTAYITNDAFIGDTTTGSGRLFITDSSNQGITLRRTGATGDRFKLFVGNGTTYTQDNAIILGTNTDIDFYTGSSPLRRMTIGNGGNIGIGTNAGSGLLHIVKDGAGNSNTSITGSQLVLSRTTGFGENLAFRNTGSSAGISGTTYAGQIISAGNNIMEIYTDVANPIVLGTNATERMRITSGGNVGIGINSPQSIVHALVNNATAPTSGTTPSGYGLSFGSGDGYNGGLWFSSDFGGDQGIAGIAASRVSGYQTDLRFYTNNTNAARAFTERMRITSGGYVKASNNGTYLDSTASYHEFKNNTANGYTVYITNASASPASTYIADFYFSAATPNNSSARFINCDDATATRFYVSSDGIVHSTSTSITIIASDVKLKTNIRDYDKGLAEVLAMKPRYYNFKDNLEKQEIGFIAQEMEEALPGSMIDVKSGRDTEETHKTYQLDWYPLLVKAIQEQQATITSLQEQINELKNK
jgi:hypothetical protein